MEQVATFQAQQFSGIDVELMGERLHRDLLAEARVALERSGLGKAEAEQKSSSLEELLAGINFTNVALHTLEENIFETALNAVVEQFREQPLVQARLLETLSQTMRAAGLLEAA